MKPELDIDDLKENGFLDSIRKDKNAFQMTFVFPTSAKGAIFNYIEINTKEYLEKQILELCQNAEVK